VRAQHEAVKNVRLKEEANPREGGMILLPKRLVQVRIFMLVPARRTNVKAKQSEPEIEIEKMMEGMQEARKALAMAETAQNNMLNQLADRDREIVKLRDTLEGMEVKAGAGAPACSPCGAHEVAPARSGPGACRCRGGFARNAWQLGHAGGLPQLLHMPNPDGDADGDADCTACLPGYFRDPDESAALELADPAAAHCEACPSGTPLAASASAADCAMCEVGSYIVSTGEGRFCRPCMLHANTSDEFLGAFDEHAADAADHPESALFLETIGLCRCATGFEHRASAGAAAALAALDAGVSGFSLADALALEGNLSCAPCVGVKFKPAPGNAPCAACPAGTGPAPAHLLPAGLRARPEDACTQCPARTYSRLRLAEDGGEVFE
jgi:hypothetical protein